jgi:hypothetical protein
VTTARCSSAASAPAKTASELTVNPLWTDADLITPTGLIGWRSGVLWPNITRDPSTSSFTISTDRRAFDISILVRNDGFVALDIFSAGRSGLGLTLIRARIAESHLRHNNQTEITLEYQVTDCGTVQDGDWPVPLRVSQGRTAYIEPPEMSRPDGPSMYTYSGRNPYAMPWQVKLAGMACGRIPMGA